MVFFSLSLSLRLKEPREKLISSSLEFYRREPRFCGKRFEMKNRRRDNVVNRTRRNPFSKVNRSSDYQWESCRKLPPRFGPDIILLRTREKRKERIKENPELVKQNGNRISFSRRVFPVAHDDVSLWFATICTRARKRRQERSHAYLRQRFK